MPGATEGKVRLWRRGEVGCKKVDYLKLILFPDTTTTSPSLHNLWELNLRDDKGDIAPQDKKTPKKTKKHYMIHMTLGKAVIRMS